MTNKVLFFFILVIKIVNLKENKIRKDCTQIPETAFLLIKKEELHFIDYKGERYT